MKVDRLVSIIMILLDKERIGARELADRFEVSPRTIYRDIDAINLAGIPVHAVSGVGGGFEMMQAYKIDRKVFSMDDLSAILMGLTSLSDILREKELGKAIAKVKSFVPANKTRDMEIRANQILIDLRPWVSNRNIQPYLESIKTALQENRLLSFAYTDRHGNATVRTAEPYQLVLKGSHWYFQGYCHTRKDFRLFKLTRIANLQVQADVFTPRAYQKPQLAFADDWPAMLAYVQLRIHRSIMDQVLDYCAYDQFTPDGAEHFLVRFPFIENEYNYHILLGFGDRCECLAPLPVRREMKRRIRDMAACYAQDGEP